MKEINSVFPNIFYITNLKIIPSMKSKKKKKQEVDRQKALFYKEAERVYVPMSDGAELLCYFTKKGKNTSGVTILFIPGYASIPMSWNDLWDCIYEEFDLYVLETREKITSKVKWSHKGDMNRSGMDIGDAIRGLKLDPKKTVILCASASALYVMRGLAEKWIDEPLGMIMIGPVRTPILPSKLIYMTKFTPSFLINWMLRSIGKIWIGTAVPKGVQRDRYREYIGTASAMRWKKTRWVTFWDGTEDFKKVKVPTLMVGAIQEDLHINDETKICVNLVETSEYLQVSSFMYMHHLPGAADFTKKVSKYIEKIIT